MSPAAVNKLREAEKIRTQYSTSTYSTSSGLNFSLVVKKTYMYMYSTPSSFHVGSSVMAFKHSLHVLAYMYPVHTQDAYFLQLQTSSREKSFICDLVTSELFIIQRFHKVLVKEQVMETPLAQNMYISS